MNDAKGLKRDTALTYLWRYTNSCRGNSVDSGYMILVPMEIMILAVILINIQENLRGTALMVVLTQFDARILEQQILQHINIPSREIHSC